MDARANSLFHFSHPDVPGNFSIFIDDLVTLRRPCGVTHKSIQLRLIGELFFFLRGERVPVDVPYTITFAGERNLVTILRPTMRPVFTMVKCQLGWLTAATWHQHHVIVPPPLCLKR